MKELRRISELGSEPRLRVAVISDTHGFIDPRVADAVAQHDCAVHAGDVGGTGVLRALRPRRGLVYAVRGNNDVPFGRAPDARCSG